MLVLEVNKTYNAFDGKIRENRLDINGTLYKYIQEND